MQRFSFRNRNQRGDTIVEVLFALAVLGAVLGSSYVVVNRNVKTNQSSQERLAAVKIAESQLERLKVASVTNPAILTSNDICLTETNQVEASSSNLCRVDAAGSPTTDVLAYRIAITKVTDTAVVIKYKISVKWLNIRGSGDDTLDYFYEVYR